MHPWIDPKIHARGLIETIHNVPYDPKADIDKAAWEVIHERA